jgi:flagellar biosynthetic protein FlhB
MAEEDQDQKTEEPTGKRLDEARDRGQLPISREVSAWVMFVGIIIVLAWLVPPMALRMLSVLRVFLEMPHAISLEGNGLQNVFFNALQHVALATLLIYAVLAAAAVLGTMSQTGLFASLTAIQPDFTRLSFASGFRRLFSTRALVELGKSFVKLVVLGTVVFFTLMPIVRDLPSMQGQSLMDSMLFLYHQAIHLIILLMVVFTVIAVVDIIYQRHIYIKSLRMTKAEVKDEFRQQEGDPMIKNRLRQIRLEKARKRMMAQVPKADVVVTNPTHYAVAMKYDNTKMAAPVVLAKGVDRIAERIREVAEEHRIPLVSNPPLARALYDTVEIDREIPTQHYRAVAEVISYVYRLRRKKP